MTPYEYRFRVRLHAVDHAGVMFFSHLFVHAHDAYENFMAELGFGLNALIGADVARLPVVHAGADYFSPLRHGEEITVHLNVLDLGSSSFTIGYEFHCGALRARAKTVHVFVATQDGRPTPLPGELRQWLEPHRGCP